MKGILQFTNRTKSPINQMDIGIVYAQKALTCYYAWALKMTLFEEKRHGPVGLLGQSTEFS